MGFIPDKTEGSASEGNHHMGIKGIGHDAEHTCVQHGLVNEEEKKK